MKRVLLLSLLVGCSVENKLQSVRDFSVESAGEQANFARKHLSDRGISSEQIADKLATTDDVIGEQANAAREYFSDRNFSGEDLQNFETQASKDIDTETSYAAAHVGKKANESRDYMYDRGIEEMRYGDKDLTDTVSDHESRLKLLESISAKHSDLLSVLFELSANEKAAREVADESQAAALAAEQAAREAGDSSEAAARAQADSAMSTQFASDLASMSSFFQGQMEAMQSDLNNLTSQVNSQGSDIDAIQDHLVVVDHRLDVLKHKVKKLKKLTKLHTVQIAKLKHRLNWEIYKRKAKDQQLKNMIDNLSNDLNAVNDSLQDQISLLVSDLASTDAAVAAIDGRVVVVEGALGAISDVQDAIASAISLHEANEQVCTLGSQSMSISVPNQFDGVCGTHWWASSSCKTKDFSNTATITFSVPKTTCN